MAEPTKPGNFNPLDKITKLDIDSKMTLTFKIKYFWILQKFGILSTCLTNLLRFTVRFIVMCSDLRFLYCDHLFEITNFYYIKVNLLKATFSFTMMLVLIINHGNSIEWKITRIALIDFFRLAVVRQASYITTLFCLVQTVSKLL